WQGGKSPAKKGKYEIGDKGPGDGIVFAVDGYTYYEVSHILGVYNWNDAKREAANYRGGGFTDWRLPTLDELNNVYVNLVKSGKANLGSNWHWSSLEYSGYNDSAWGQHFGEGQKWRGLKRDAFSVRAVRVFTP
ncbi:MAG: DUF1566 domain-containing protein, partial [Leptospirales bacterium]|nr:DUF1566 domain-containing protein [Leptospirales bacterium]